MDTNPTISSGRQATLNSLAVVGFLALVALGVWSAIYSTRFVPTVVNRIGAAAVYLGSVFTPAPGSTLSVVPTPTASTTIPFGATTTSAHTTSTAQTAPKPKPAATTGNVKTGGTPASVSMQIAPYGLADLAVSIVEIGYQTGSSPDTFVASSSVPSGALSAVKVIIKNIGTNYSGTWSLRASIASRSTPAILNQLDSLAPGEERAYIAAIDQVARGSEQTFTITANFDNLVPESNTSNNEASKNITVL